MLMSILYAHEHTLSRGQFGFLEDYEQNVIVDVAYTQTACYSGGMENMAVAAYFQMLRARRTAPNGKRLTQGALAKLIAPYLPNRKVDQPTISKALSGEDAISGDLLAALLEVLGGRLEDVVWLFGRSDPEEGRQRAIEALAAELPSEGELDKLIADWQSDEQMRRSLRRAWLARSVVRASVDADHE